MKWLLVFCGGGLGAASRYAVSYCLTHHKLLAFPWATFLSNALSCLLLGLFVLFFQQKSNQPLLFLFLVTGFCGGFSTFSTFAYDNLLLVQKGHYLMFFLNVGCSIALGMVLVWIMAKRL